MLKAGLAVIVWGYIAMMIVAIMGGMAAAILDPRPPERRGMKVAEQLHGQDETERLNRQSLSRARQESGR